MRGGIQVPHVAGRTAGLKVDTVESVATRNKFIGASTPIWPQLCDRLGPLFCEKMKYGPYNSGVRELIDMSPVPIVQKSATEIFPIAPKFIQITGRKKKLTSADIHGIKNTKQDKLYYAVLKKHFDLCDFAWNHDKQKPNHIIEKHLNAGADWRNRLPKIKLREIAVRRHFGGEMFMKPIRTATDKSIAVRFDANAKHGEPDAKALVNWIATKLPGLYDEPSKSGHSGWAFFDLIPMKFRDGTINYERRERTKSH